MREALGGVASEAEAGPGAASKGGAEGEPLSGSGEVCGRGGAESSEGESSEWTHRERQLGEGGEAGQEAAGGDTADTGRCGTEPHGDLVITYEDFLAYLGRKHPAVRQTCLGFKGRNAVLHVLDYGDVGGGDAAV